MPYNIRKIDPRVREERKALGVRFPFSRESVDGKQGEVYRKYTVFTSTYRTSDLIKSNLMNYFMTAKGERYLNPSFGNEILNLLFENPTEEEKQLALEQVRLDLASYFPEIEVQVLDLTSVENSLQLHMEYSIKYAGEEDEITVNFGQ